MTGPNGDIFVSYKAEDRARVRPLVDALMADGLSVWWDAHIGAGEDWRESIAANLDQARCVIVIWSKRSVGPDGRFVRDEAARAMKRHAYLPVTIDKVDPPLGFGETQCLPLANWKGNREDPRYLALLDAARHAGSGAPIQRGPVPAAVAKHRGGVDRRAVMAGGAVAGLAAAGGVGWLFLHGAPANANSVAVLPFANLSGDPGQAYFSDGMAEEVRSALSRINGLKVIGRASSELLRNDDIPGAAKRLDVGSIVTGSVRRSTATIRVSAQLVDGSNGVEKWSQTFDRPTGDVLQIQTSIAEAVAEQLRSQLGASDRAALSVGGTTSAAAQDLVLRADADQDGSKAGFERRAGLYDQAVALDPNYASAWAGKARATTNVYAFYATTVPDMQAGLDTAATFARKAISLAPDLADGHAALAFNAFNRLDFTMAWAENRRAIASPGCSPRNIVAAVGFLGQIGQVGKAQQLWRSAADRDPLNPDVLRSHLGLLLAARRYQELLPQAQKYVAENTNSTQGQNLLATVLLLTGRYADALRATDKLPHEHPNWYVYRSVIAARTGNRVEAVAVLNSMRAFAGDSAHLQYAEMRAQMGDHDGAIQDLNAALKFRDPGLSLVQQDALFDPLRANPRFQALVRELNFPAA
jgi:serine/threonine-protein kinase